ncbi:hypothetical protein CFC21_044132 [Triticum aestivum]|uniref:Serpin domain-containing protein n=2 Tax=Triticum aestivum TaxID=4565 RepID=A0A9R1FQ84_WHEAT|nr:serpin-Z1-like [Triticum dicoccoides]XP_044345526.1 serpin-Z1-like [Triticum aestivum]KAF7033006.1 hypothetical protein CFC21_044132 [Triticum aestivum]
MEPEVAEAARGEAAFSIRALHHIALAAGASASSKNIAVSPVSIHAAVMLLGTAARGATLDEIVAFLGPAGGRAHALLASDVALRVLAHSAGDHGGPKVRFANSVWVDAASARLKADYAGVVADQFRAQAYAASFTTKPEEARRDINRWVQAATAGRIKGFLPQGSVGAGTRVILANALYFKGVWESKFDARLTQQHRFYLLNGGHVRVPFMSSGESQHIACCPEWKVLKLHYAPGRRGVEHLRRHFAMYVYLPNELHGLPSMVRKLASSPELLEAGSMDLRDMVPVRDFRLPKFTVSYKTEATGLLQGLGLRLPFDDDAADFSEMLEDSKGSLVVSNVYHQSLVEVNEEGTEAAATTAVTSMTFTCPAVMSRPVKYVDFVADHPFMFLTKEELTGVVVFAGLVLDPSS